jgi:hypothetical protein
MYRRHRAYGYLFGGFSESGVDRSRQEHKTQQEGEFFMTEYVYAPENGCPVKTNGATAAGCGLGK